MYVFRSRTEISSLFRIYLLVGQNDRHFENAMLLKSLVLAGYS